MFFGAPEMAADHLGDFERNGTGVCFLLGYTEAG
jgi:hypothetical protein